MNFPIYSLGLSRTFVLISGFLARLVDLILNLLYGSLLLLASPFLLYSSFKTGKYREGFRMKFLGLVPARLGDERCLWLHAVSVGEVNLLAHLIKKLRKKYPQDVFVITSTTKTGYELAQKKHPETLVYYCPLDFSWAIRIFIYRLRPAVLILAELELWPNMIRISKRSGMKVAIINGRVSDNSYRGYLRIRELLTHVLDKIDLIASQDKTTSARFVALGAAGEVVHTVGSLKYEGAETARKNLKTAALADLAGIASDEIIFLLGSTQDPEEQYGLDIFSTLGEEFPKLRLIFVPRHPQRFEEVAEKLTEAATLNPNFVWKRRSELEKNGPLDSNGRPWRVLLVDTIGELGSWWGVAQIGFVGGSFGSRGGQNMLEPAAYGVATCFGPHTRNFRDIVAALVAEDAAEVVPTYQAMLDFVRLMLADPEECEALGALARDFVQTQLGATEKTCQLLDEIL